VFDGKHSVQVGFPAGISVGGALPDFRSLIFIKKRRRSVWTAAVSSSFFVEKSCGELARLSLSLVVTYCNSSVTTISLLKVSLELTPP
jgi:hypothetical protein